MANPFGLELLQGLTGGGNSFLAAYNAAKDRAARHRMQERQMQLAEGAQGLQESQMLTHQNDQAMKQFAQSRANVADMPSQLMQLQQANMRTRRQAAAPFQRYAPEASGEMIESPLSGLAKLQAKALGEAERNKARERGRVVATEAGARSERSRKDREEEFRTKEMLDKGTPMPAGMKERYPKPRQAGESIEDRSRKEDMANWSDTIKRVRSIATKDRGMNMTEEMFMAGWTAASNRAGRVLSIEEAARELLAPAQVVERVKRRQAAVK